MELTRDQVLQREIPWETYLTAKLISGTGFQMLRRYDKRQQEIKAALLDESGAAYVQLFLGILRDVTKEDTVEYVLALIDEMLAANSKRAKLFYADTHTSNDAYHPFLRLLSHQKSWFIQEFSCKILTLIIREHVTNKFNGSASSKQAQKELDDVLQNFVGWLCGQLRHPSHPTRAIPTAVSSLATLLKDPYIRKLFVHLDGTQYLAPLISPAPNQQYIQLLYEATLCIWFLSFNDACIDSFTSAGVLPKLVDVAKSSTKEKVVRVAIFALKNLVGKAHLASTMVDLGLPKVVQSLKLQAWTDEDLTEGLNALEESLKVSIKTLSSFEKFKQEVSSGSLDWTPVHKDPAFWRENISKFEDQDFQVLRMLIALLNTSKEPKTLSVCCHDLSQFIQNHPSGRMIVLDLKAKEQIMGLMEHDNPEVRREALLCVQKLLLRAKYASYLQS